jgi:hypothetical protein
MPENEETKVDATVETEETTETSEETTETAAEDAGEQTSTTEETHTETENEDEFIDDEPAYVSQFKFPEHIKTIDEAMKYAQTLQQGLLPDMKRGQTEAEKKLELLEQKLADRGGVDSILKESQGQPAGYGIQYLSESPKLKQLIQSGDISPDVATVIPEIDNIIYQSNRTIATVLTKIIEQVDNLSKTSDSATSEVRQMQYDKFAANCRSKKIPVLSKDKLDKILGEIPNLGNYDKAFRYLMATDQDSVIEMLKDVGKSAESQAFKKWRGSASKSGMKGKGAVATKPNFSEYLTVDGKIDESKLSRLSKKEADAMIDKIIAWQEKGK